MVSRRVICIDGPRKGREYFFAPEHGSFNLNHIDFEHFQRTGEGRYCTSVYDICVMWGTGVLVGCYRGRL